MANITGDNQINILNGTLEDDTIWGLDGRDELNGFAGNDTLYGGHGRDFIYGGIGDDIIYGDNGENYLYGQWGNDTLIGGRNNDVLDGGSDVDVMRGGSGNDYYIVDNTGDIVEETESADSSADMVSSYISYTLPANVEKLYLAATPTAINGTGNDEDNLIDGNFKNNILIGKAGNDHLIGYEGNDRLQGGAGFDWLYGGTGDDFLFSGEDGGDLDGGEGADVMTGSASADIYRVDNANDIIIEQAAEGIDQVWSSISYTLGAHLENLTLVERSPWLNNINGTGNNLDNQIYGNIGDNTLKGGKGNDTMDGENGSDRLFGGDGDDLLTTTNVINSDEHNIDLLSGGNGNDRLESILDHHVHMTGGAGEDAFSFYVEEKIQFNVTTAIITDFASGQDIIELRQVFGQAPVTFTFIGEQAFNAADATGQVRFDAANHLLLGNTNADSTADFSIKLLGVDSLSATDLML